MVPGAMLAEGRTREGEEETEQELDVAEEQTEARRGGRLEGEETLLSPRFGTSWTTRPRDPDRHQADQPGPKSKE